MARVQRAASAVVADLLARLPPLVCDGGWWPGRHEPMLVATGRRFVQVHCSCPPDVAQARVRARHRWDSALIDTNYERFSALRDPLRLPGPVVVLDTTLEIPTAGLAAQVRKAAEDL